MIFYKKRNEKKWAETEPLQREKTDIHTPFRGCLPASVFFFSISARCKEMKNKIHGKRYWQVKADNLLKKNTDLQPPAAIISMSAEKPHTDKENRQTVRKENCIDFLVVRRGGVTMDTPRTERPNKSSARIGLPSGWSGQQKTEKRHDGVPKNNTRGTIT